MLYSEQIRSALTITSGWMDRWPPEVRTVAVCQGRHQLGKGQSLIDPDQQVIGIDEIPQLLGGELEQSGVPYGTGPEVRSSAASAITPTVSTSPTIERTCELTIGIDYSGADRPTTRSR